MKELFMILKNLREVEDVDYSYSKSYNTLFIVINDFNGFDDNWDEVDRNYNKPELVDELIKFINTNTTLMNEHSLDEHYSFNGINIQLSYSSEDI